MPTMRRGQDLYPAAIGPQIVDPADRGANCMLLFNSQGSESDRSSSGGTDLPA